MFMEMFSCGDPHSYKIKKNFPGEYIQRYEAISVRQMFHFTLPNLLRKDLIILRSMIYHFFQFRFDQQQWHGESWEVRMVKNCMRNVIKATWQVLSPLSF